MCDQSDNNKVNPELAAEIIEHNRITSAALAPLYDLSLPNMYHWYERHLLQEDVRLIRSLAPSPKAIRVLDIGTGTGRVALQFVRQGWSVDGVDISPEMLALCQRKYDAIAEPKGCLRLICSDVDKVVTGIAGSYDVLSFSSVLHHLPFYLKVVAGLLDVLEPEGIVYITHEPMPLDIDHKTIPMRAIGLVDQLLRTPQQIRKHLVRIVRRQPRVHGMPLTDYHDRHGLDVPELLAILKSHSFEIKRLRRYKDRKTGVMAWLDTHLIRTPNWKFRLIAQRLQPGQAGRTGG